MATGVKRQLSMVMDLNKCIGCHTCTSACKMQWTNRNGREYMYWNNVETQPGRGYPRDYESMGGGFDEAGNLKIDREPSAEDYGIPWEYNFEESLMTDTDPWMRPNVKPTGGANWDKDEGTGDYPNSYYFYLPRICNHCDVVVGLSGASAHFDGRRWSRRVTGTTADLLGVAPLDDTRWLAVGTRGTALVWDGTAWIEEDTGTDAGLRGLGRP